MSVGQSGSFNKASSSSSSSTRAPVSISPIQGVLANLFGLGTGIKKGGIQLQDDKNVNFANQAFGPSSFDALGDFIETSFFGDAPAQIAAGGLEGGLGLIDQAQGVVGDLLETGNPVDVQPLVDQSLTDVAEQLTPVTGLFSSDLAAAGQRTASQLRVGAEERARERQFGAVPLSTLLAQAPTDIASGLLNLESQQLLQGTESGRALTLLQALAGITPTSAIVGQDSKSKANSLGISQSSNAGIK